MSADLLQQLNGEMAEVVERVKQSLVHVSNNGQSHGAGIVIRPDGLILTNAHVIRYRSVQVTLPDGRSVSARIVAYDPDRDLAALRVEAQGLSALELADSGNLLPGQWVFAVGHPWGIAGAVTSGIAIGGAAALAEQPNSRGWLAANLHLRPGNSGGPLVDVQGNLIGINTVMAGPEVGLAISAEVVRAFLHEHAEELGPGSYEGDSPDTSDTPYTII